MDASDDRRLRGRGSVGWTIRVLAVVLGAAGPAANAAPIRHGVVHQRSVHVDATSYWNSYFQQALRTHNLHIHSPKIEGMLHVESNGMLHQSAIVSYLSWRRGLNAQRFDRFHPTLAQMLIRNDQVRQAVLKTPPVTHPPTPPSQPTLAPHGLIPPPTVPEPSTGLIALMMTGAAWWVRRRRSRR